MKRILLMATLALCACTAFGQAMNGSVKVARDLQPAAVIQLPYSSDLIDAALADHLSRKGRAKSTDIRGFTAFRNMQAATTDSANADLYFKVERKSRQEKGSTLVSLLLTAPREGDVATTSQHHLNMEEAKAYLNELVPAIEAYALEQSIKDQNAAIIRAESRYKSLIDDSEDLEKKRLANEKKIAENKMAAQAQESEVAAQKQKLEALVRQRKN